MVKTTNEVSAAGEEAFPRGGKQLLSAAEKKRLREEAKVEAERDFLSTEPGKRKRKSSKDAEVGSEDLAFAREASQGRVPKFAELLRFTNISVGAKIWGCISAISHKELIVSLPDGLRGTVPLHEASDVLAEQLNKVEKEGGVRQSTAGTLPSLQALFRVGQFVRATVMELQEGTAETTGGPKKRVVLSLKVAKQNGSITAASLFKGLTLPACVRSIEDHGYTLTFGIKGATGFLDKSGVGDAASLLPGSLLEVVVRDAADKRMIRAILAAAEKQGSTKEWPGLTIGSLLPGMLVSATVQNVLSDGLLVSFLTFFVGTVDPFHISKEGTIGSNWKDAFSVGQRVKARVLYVDTNSKRVCLSLLPHLLKMQSPSLPTTGTLIKEAAIQRVDPALGVLLDLAAHGSGYAHISDISDERIAKLDKVLKVGQQEAARVIGARPMDGLAVLSLKPSAVEQFLVDGVHVGDTVKGEVVMVDDKGLLVNIVRNLNAFVPNEHVSDLGVQQGKAKHKVGSKVSGRILRQDPLKRRMTMTLKKALIGSKLKPLICWEDVEIGARAHGTVDGIIDFGIFVRFYGDMRGLVHVSELGLEPGVKPTDAYAVGQVVKVRIMGADPAANRMQLSLTSKQSKAEAERGALSPGMIGVGVVTEIVSGGGDHEPTAFKVDLKQDGKSVGSGHLEAAHLSDHPAAAEALRDGIQVGTEIGKLLVLEQVRGAQTWRLTRKASLVNSASTLPKSPDELAEAQILYGYVASVAQDSVFVRFLNGLTGRAGLAQLSDSFVSDPGEAFSKDQSVRAQVVQVNKEKGHFSLSLQRSATGNASALFTAALFRDLELAAQLKAVAEEAEGEPPVEWSKFQIGARVKGSVNELKEYGTLVDLYDDPNIVGLVAPHQTAAEYAGGEALQLRVLDINKKDGILDLTEKPSLLEGAPFNPTKKQKQIPSKEQPAAPKLGEVVLGEVQLHRDEYAVVSLPQLGQAIGFVGLEDFNMRNSSVQELLPLRSRRKFTVADLPSEATGGRLVLQATDPRDSPTHKKQRRAKMKPGTVVEATVMDTHVAHVLLEISDGVTGRAHVTEVTDDSSPEGNPLEAFQFGQVVRAVVLGARRFGRKGRKGGSREGGLELSMRPSAVAAAERGEDFDQRRGFGNVREGDVLTGFVTHIDADSLHVALGPKLTGRVGLLDMSPDPAKLDSLAERLDEAFSLGQPLKCRVDKVDRDTSRLDLSLIIQPPEGLTLSTDAQRAAPGSFLNGRIVRIEGGGVKVKLGWHVSGTIPLIELHDQWVEDALAGLTRGKFVRCCVIEGSAAVSPPVKKAGGEEAEEKEDDRPEDCKLKRKRDKESGKRLEAQLQLSLRASKGGFFPGWTTRTPGGGKPASDLTLDQLAVDSEVQGYVKSVGKDGVFVALGRNLDARIRLSHLADKFVREPAASFPVGKLVKGRILNAAPGKVEMTLRTKKGLDALLRELSEGQTVRGEVTRVEEFGLFVRLRGSALVGLVHTSELDDKFTKMPADLFKAGQGVRAKVLSVNPEKGRLRLGLKPSYFVGEEEGEAEEEGDDKAAVEEEVEESDLEDLLDTADVDSDDGADWRNAAAGDEEEQEDGKEEDGTGEEGDEASPVSGSLDVAVDRAKRRKLQPGKAKDTQDEVESNSGEESNGEEEEEEDGEARLSIGDATGTASAAEALLSVSVGWEDDEGEEGEPNGLVSNEDGAAPAKQPNKRQLKRQKKEKEAAIRAAEAARLEGRAPETAADFERELMGSPDSSYLWIRYMAFLISLGETGKARGVAERALAKINYRKEEEKFNMWVAWLNLEMKYGDPPEDAAAKLFQRALSFNHQKKLYLAFLGILDRANQEELLAQTFKAATRKFPESAKVWLRQLAHLQTAGDADGAAKLLERAIASLPKRKHIKVLRQAALQEFKFGSPERGRSIFENLLRNYPKRLDLWSVYIDQEIKEGEPTRIRTLFERATSLILPAKKIKFLFKRNLEYESQHGTPATVSKVKQAAKEYIQHHLEA